MPKTKAPSYLEQMNNGAWRVTLTVPKDVKPIFGKSKLKKALGTHSLSEAERLKHAVLAEFFALIDKARSGSITAETARHVVNSDDYRENPIAAALELRREIFAYDPKSEEREGLIDTAEIIARDLLGPEYGIDDLTREAIYDSEKETLADQFFNIATGKITPAREQYEQFNAESKWTARTKSELRRALDLLEAWCITSKTPFIIERITRRSAGRFIAALIDGDLAKIQPRTINKYLTTLRAYWKWMAKRGYLDDDHINPWDGQSLPKEKPKEGEEERPFTDDEMIKLIRGKPHQPYIKTVMLIAALTGARIDAITSLRRQDISDDGFFRFKAQKKEQRSRRVAIHSTIRPLIDSLIANRDPQDDLFPECPQVPKGKAQERSSPASKAFTRYRKTVGVDDQISGKRRGRVNFHSFRRWFITKAIQAGQPELVVQMVVGHKPQSITSSVYLGGLSDEQIRQCVEAVQLPIPLDENT